MINQFLGPLKLIKGIFLYIIRNKGYFRKPKTKRGRNRPDSKDYYSVAAVNTFDGAKSSPASNS